ncbi:MAG: hypothetical protein ACTHN3_07510 [Solirubrobacterales bacterium]
MKYVKILGLFALTAAALMAFTGNASATTLTSPAGTTYTGAIVAESEGENTLINTSIGLKVQCEVSKVEGKVEMHGTGVTAAGKLTSLTFEKCTNNYSVKVFHLGALEIHNISGTGNGTVTSNGTQVTVSTPLGFSCVYETSSTDIGTLTGGAPVTLDIGSATIPRVSEESPFCGSSGTWTGSYKVTTPGTLLVDP